VSFIAIAVDKTAVEIRTSFGDTKFIFILFYFSLCFGRMMNGTYLSSSV
jgi:hypothetical protein